MAKIMPYTDDRGVDYPFSYWNLAFCSLQPKQKTGSISFNGFANKTIRQNGGFKPIAVKDYFVTPDLYDQYFSVEAQAQAASFEEICYKYAMDIMEPVNLDANPEAVAKSFFDGAVNDL